MDNPEKELEQIYIVDEPIQINGHEVTFGDYENDTVKVGCAYVPTEVFIDLSMYVTEYDLAIFRGGEDITKQVIKTAEKL